jgi:NAD(P)-dependent dehydrogenase (short-subunit alcohol dehydrogenase family)
LQQNKSWAVISLTVELTKIFMSNYLIIGASSGIGKRLAEKLVESGHQVYGTYYKNELQPVSNRIQLFPLNVLDESISLDFLPETLSGIVYCPGSINLRPFERIKPADFINDYNLQVVGAIKIIQAVASKLKAGENAAIILFSTVAVQTGLAFHSQVSASKGAIEGLTKALAAEYAPKIRVNCIAPSLTDTPLAAALLNSDQKKQANAERHPLKRVGTTDDIANMAEFLLSSKASWITGQILHVDGGFSTLKV